MAEPIVQIANGKLRGKKYKNFQNREYFAFKGIPYALPPIGKLRFRAPMPPENWDGIRDAMEHGEICRAPDEIDPSICIGTENCLYLNVYTTMISPITKPKAVMVWIHGGGFVQGRGNCELYGPDYLIGEDIVLVTINYRLGPLGFMAFSDPKIEVPGNAGLKDMVMALKWVQANIKNFNGDPNNVTIFGESAGGAAVHYLILSQLAEGLFHKAICQSGTANCNWAHSDLKPEEIAKLLGFDSTDQREIYEFLLKCPIEDLVDAVTKSLHQITALEKGLKKSWAPIAEIPCASEPTFITEHPHKLLIKGVGVDVPIMMGYTADEGLLYLSPLIPKELMIPMNITDVKTILPACLFDKNDLEKTEKIGEKILKFYYGNTIPNSENIEPYIKLMMDLEFVFPMYVSLKSHIKHKKSPLYFYKFCVESQFSPVKKLFQIDLPGVCHIDDLSYLFSNDFSPIVPETGSLERKTIYRMTQLWTSFAKNGVPSTEDFNDWKPVTGSTFNYLEIAEKLELHQNPDHERLQFWNDLMKEFKIEL